MKSYQVVVLSAIVLGVYAASLDQLQKRDGSQFVAFSAGLTGNVQLVQNDTIKYDHVFLNQGNGYNKMNGVFTCPMDGSYVFIYHGLTETSGQMWLDVYKNGVYELTGYAHTSGDYASASNSIVLDLVNGDTVYIRGRGNSTLYGLPDEVYSTFSGFLLFAGHEQAQGQ